MMLVQAAADARLHAVPSHASTASVSVVIPALNEERCIAWVLERLPDIVGEVILVDGRSTDRTIEIARAIRPTLKLVLEPTPGKGAALRAGFAAATGDYIVMLDADGSMDPAEIERFVNALQDGLEFVKGSRFAQGGGTTDMSLIRRLGNGALRSAVNRLYRTNLSDLCYGYIAFRRDRLNNLRLRSEGFEIETEMTVRAVTASLRIGEVASYEYPRRHGKSNLHAWRDGRRILRTLVRERLVLPATPCQLAQARGSRAGRRAV
jgi:glycosyltransferase involved in cell wall biosynthesis